MTKIDAITKGLSNAPYFALTPRMIAALRSQTTQSEKTETGPKAA